MKGRAAAIKKIIAELNIRIELDHSPTYSLPKWKFIIIIKNAEKNVNIEDVIAALSFDFICISRILFKLIFEIASLNITLK